MMRLRSAFPWLVVGALVTLLVVLSPRLRADGEPPSGVLGQPEPAAVTNASEDRSSAGLLAPGAVGDVAPAAEEPAAAGGPQGGASGLLEEPASAADGQAPS